jgi:CheY-like chemotaxis protein
LDFLYEAGCDLPFARIFGRLRWAFRQLIYVKRRRPGTAGWIARFIDAGLAGSPSREGKLRVLIVEDEWLVALEIRLLLEDLGHEVIGIAPDSRRAHEIAERGVDVALVDLNLRDGLTGPSVGAELVGQGATVLFMTANPSQLGNGVSGAVGVLAKPVEHEELKQAADFIEAVRYGRSPPPPPHRLRQFAAARP